MGMPFRDGGDVAEGRGVQDRLLDGGGEVGDGST